MIIDKWIKTAQSALVGPRCILCRAPALLERELCDDCLGDLPWLGLACDCCALALPADTDARRCPACIRKPRFDAAIAAFGYHEPIRWLIGRLKFQARLAHARLLGDLLVDRVHRADTARPEALIPIPLHAAGYRRRGFNQAERIATRLARGLERPLAGGLVQRIRDTRRQSELVAAQRAANIRGAFACPRPVPYRHVAIVDDVVTTTQTAAEVARKLRAAGAARVDLYCVARA